MAKYYTAYDTTLPDDLIDVMCKQLHSTEGQLRDATTFNDSGKDVRDSKVTWLQDTSWIAGLCFYYVMKANRENFLYDLDSFDDGTLQYTYYSSGGHYSWHSDQCLLGVSDSLDRSSSWRSEEQERQFVVRGAEKVRKLSFSLQLSDPSEYEGGELQIMHDDGTMLTLPREKGKMAVFDSRTLHRVRKVTDGQRRVLVGWVVGPRWR